MTPSCDVVVFGGGPAGTATAIALQARGLTSVVLERTRYESPAPGETLLGDALPILSTLGVSSQLRERVGAAAQPIVSVWGDAVARERPPRLNPFGAGWHVDRSWFDGMLAQTAEAAGALVYCDVRPSGVERVRNGWRVPFRSRGGCVGVLQTRFLIDATGRAAWLARRMGSATRRIDCLVALIAHYPRSTGVSSLLVEAAPHGWWYSVPLPGSRAIGVYLTDGDLVSGRQAAAVFHGALASTTQTRDRLGPLGAPLIRVVAAQTSERVCCAGDGWLAVGDAVFALDPLSGSGIRRALESGVKAANVVAATMQGERDMLVRYQVDASGRFAAQLRMYAHHYRAEHRWASSPFWARRQRPQAA